MSMKNRLNTKEIATDVLIIGGGTAGCYAALVLSEQKAGKVLIAEKANIKRSGCLAAGVNAINAYIVKGRKPQDYVDYATKDAAGIVRKDLLLTAAENFNEVTAKMEKLGLVILKDENGDYVARGNRNIKINGENFKPLLADAVHEAENVDVLNYVNITDLLVKDGQVYGAVGFSIMEETAYIIRAKAVLVATGGAAGLYKPNNPGFSRHKMWYPPFNTGAGYAMGILAGAEMTSFEMRFIALRCKDTIAPTGTIAYLNMAPSQTLKWIESGKSPSEQDVEIQGTEPYIVGGHTASGYWVNTGRETTVKGLYAAGDVAGGCPQKYVTGALAEGKLAALDMVKQFKAGTLKEADIQTETEIKVQEGEILSQYEKFRNEDAPAFSVEELEEAMQKVMDEYAGGIASNYQFNEKQLALADEKILQLQALAEKTAAADMHELMFAYELRERLIVCRSLIAHLKNRKETRWHSFNENLDHPETDEKFYKYVNSKLENGEIRMIFRDIVKEDTYEHTN